MHFDVLQHHTTKLDQILATLCHVVDMTDELHDAAKLAGETDYREKHDRQSRAYEVLDVLITAVMWQSGQVREGMADFLKASPIPSIASPRHRLLADGIRTGCRRPSGWLLRPAWRIRGQERQESPGRQISK